MLKTHFKGESETQKMLNLKDFGGRAMNWNIGVEYSLKIHSERPGE